MVSKSNQEIFMKEEDYRKVEIEQNNMQIILNFPKKSKDEEDSIKKEVKQILSDMLQEYLAKIS